MTSEGLGKMFEGDFADMCAEKFTIGRAECGACAYMVMRTAEIYDLFKLIRGYELLQ